MVKAGHILLVLFVFLLVCFMVLPFFPLIIWSMTKQWPWPELLPHAYSLESWRYLFSPSGRAWEGLGNSTIIAIITLCINMLLGIPAARVLAQKQFIGKGFLVLVLLSPLFIPFTASIMGLHTISIHLHFLNEYIGVSLAHVLVTFPYFFITLLYQFRLLGTELQEAAKGLGASTWQTFWWIEFVHMLPAFSVASMLVILISFSQYLPTWIMSGGTLLTLPLIMFPFASSGNSSIVAVYSLWFFIPILLLLIIYFVLLRSAGRVGRM